VFIFLLVLYLIALSLGIGLLILGLLTLEKLRLKPFRDASFFAVAAILLLLVDAVRTSVTALRLDFDPGLRVFCLILAVLGNGVMVYALTSLAFRVVDVRIGKARFLFHVAAFAALVFLAYAKETTGTRLDFLLNLAGLGCLHAYCAVIVIIHFGRIVEKSVRYLLRGMLILIGGLEALLVVEILVMNFAALPPSLRGMPFYQLLYVISCSATVLFYAFKYMFKPTLSTLCELPLDFVTRYGVSGRECEIISLVIQGHSYKQIGDKLFISSRTVKNHIYNVYQKTGVANKVQLMNVIRSPGF
jgi:DNA-binding CsgD family transcriptional regulator